MSHLDTYCKSIADKKNVELSRSIKATAEEAYNLYLCNFSFVEHKIGLLFGNVQSGKTGQMFGIICRAADEGFAVFLILTTDNKVLYEQTIERVMSDLPDFCVCGEKDENKFRENELAEPCVVVLKKNFNILREWCSVFAGTGYMKGNPLFVLDDEADAASLNTLVNKSRKSSINKYLDLIKESSSSSLYLQVTGTPQALLLQTQLSGWHPDFVQYFEPGKKYLGGDFYFPANGIPDCIRLIKDDNYILEAVLRHIYCSAVLFREGKTVCNCLLHPSMKVSAHEEYADSVSSAILRLKADRELLRKKLSEETTDKSIFEECETILQNTKIIVLNGKSDNTRTDYLTGCNFIIGGNTLGRGVTFPQLQTVIYTRTAKQPQADTMWQHARMFGYDRNPELMCVYMQPELYKLFHDINETNNTIIAQVLHGTDKITVFYPEGLNPTRKNVVDKKRVSVISGGTNYFPLDTASDNQTLDRLFETFGEETYQVSLRLIDKILSCITPTPDFRIRTFRSIITSMLSNKPTTQGRLIVRKGRRVSQGTGALLSASDWKLSNSYSDTVLTMYRIEGGGWMQKEVWVPNIKLPDGVMYYDVID